MENPGCQIFSTIRYIDLVFVHTYTIVIAYCDNVCAYIYFSLYNVRFLFFHLDYIDYVLRTTVSQDVKIRFYVQLAFSKFLYKIKGIF